MKRIKQVIGYPFLAAFVFIGIMACEDILEVPDISDSEVFLLAPTEASVVPSGAVQLNWDQVNEATAYRVQVATPDFLNASQVLEDLLIPVDSTFTGSRHSLNLEAGNYEWRVRAENSDYQTEYFGALFTVSDSN